MGKRVSTILAAMTLGSVLGILAVVVLNHRSRSEHRVDGFPLAYWIKCLEDTDPAVRRGGIDSVPKFGMEAAGPLVDLLGNADADVSAAAGECLLTIGVTALPDLTEALRDRSPRKRTAAVALLERFGPAAAPVATDVARLLDDPDAGPAAMRFFVAGNLNADAIAAAGALAASGAASRRMEAIALLARAPIDDRGAVDGLIRALRGDNAEVRDAAFGELTRRPARWNELTPETVAALERPATRELARERLAAIGSAALHALTGLRSSPDPQARLASVSLIAAMSPRDEAVIAALLVFLRDPDAAVAGAARQTLLQVMEKDQKRVLALLQSSHAPERVIALEALPGFRPRRYDDALRCLDDSDARVRAQASKTLESLSPADDPVILRSARSDDPAQRARAVRLLGFSTGWWNPDPVIAAADDPDATVRRFAIESLARATFSDAARDRLLGALAGDLSPDVRAEAASALAHWRDAQIVQNALRRADKDPDPVVRRAAAQTLGRQSADW